MSTKLADFKKLNILVIRFSSFGDVVLATAFIEGLKKKYPNADIYILTKPEFNAVFVHRLEIKYKDSLHYNIIYDLSVNLRSFFFCFKQRLRGSRIIRVSKNIVARRLMVWFKIFPRSNKNISILAKYSRFLRLESIVFPKIFLGDDKTNQILTKIKSKKYIGINPSAKWKNKCWIKERYAEVINQLLKQDNYVVLFGDKGDIIFNSEIVSSLKNSDKLINLTGILNKEQLFKAVSDLDLILTTDSAVLHIAQSFKVPVVAIFGPTIKEFGFWQPNPKDILVEVDLSCRPCHLHGGDFCPKGHFRCMKDISVKTILAMLSEIGER
ncbi:MAG: glycosyltransferase family 9 protein [bacterium]|nr:glycosyltransferase family 9 protein [bacterium]